MTGLSVSHLLQGCMRPVRIVLLSAVLFSHLVSQSGAQRPQWRNKSQAFRTVQPSWGLPAVGIVRVLALRVQFRTDSDPRTSGDGTFMIQPPYGQIDPPPHDSLFFASKLRFLWNYFRKVSNGQLTIQADLFGSVVTLNDSMASYSTIETGSNSLLAKLVVDSWTAATLLDPTFPFSQYQAFVVFHAGVGRDVNLVEILGFDPTPLDIPSIFLNLASLRLLLNDPGYSGVPVNNGAFRITNSMVLPETETRALVLGTVRDTLELSINGLLAASFGSYLGLPDLFNTENGRSGIGHFGLMDGAAIFAYNGLFPPEPSAWEKLYLGWVAPITVATGSKTVTIPAVGLTTTGSDSIYKIPVNDQEYFLIENRDRDPGRNGQVLTLLQNGSLVTRHFGKDTAGFYFSDLRGISGSLVDAEDFDWAISGDMNQAGFEGGGVLVWHIDESKISSNIATNTVNADPDHRGVDLEEADGSDDIGQQYDLLEPGSGTENGWPLDAWFQGNQSPVYKNRFDGSTFPNSRSELGAQTFVSVTDFSLKSGRMALTITIGNDKFERLFMRSSGGYLGFRQPAITDSGIFLAANNGVYAFQPSGVSKTTDSSGLLWAGPAAKAPAVVHRGDTTYVAVAGDSLLTVLHVTDQTGDGRYDQVTAGQILINDRIWTDPIILDSAGQLLVAVGTLGGKLWKVDLNANVRSIRSLSAQPVSSLSWIPPGPTAPVGSLIAATANEVFSEQASIQLPSTLPLRLASARMPSGYLVLVTQDWKILGFDQTLSIKQFEIDLERFGHVTPRSSGISSLIPGDLDGDGYQDFLAVTRNALYAFNHKGILLDGFPIVGSSDGGFFGSALVYDITGDGIKDLLVQDSGGIVQGYEGTGKPMWSFSYQTLRLPEWGMFRTGGNTIGIVSTSASGSIEGWEYKQSFNASSTGWSQYLGNAQHTNANNTQVTVVARTNEFLPASRVYNWPNPVYGSTTRIRYYVAQDAAISVKIFDLAGTTITELSGTAFAGLDGEITWDVSNIQSGVYFARVEAVGRDRSDAAIIKIAVVK